MAECIELFERLAVATNLLSLGRWDEGYKEDEYRWLIPGTSWAQPGRAYYELSQRPRWNGSKDLSGKKVIAYTEGGLGDYILQLRWIEYLKERYPGINLTIKTSEYMLKLILFSLDVSVALFHNKIEADVALTLQDIPFITGLSWETVPRPAKYLKSHPDLKRKWAENLKTLPKRLNVGICWAAGNIARQTSLDLWKELLALNANFISLQKGNFPIPDWCPIINWMDWCHDFVGTAALIDNLDLVISVDTAVPHLAGSLGKEVWNLTGGLNWPWMAESVLPDPSYSVWYPSMKLIRQKHENGWKEQIDQAALFLAQRTNS